MRIAKTLRAGLTTGAEERVRTGAAGLHAYASEAGSCVRKVAYELMADRPGWTPSLTQEVAFRVGKDLEKAVLDAVELQNPTLRRQVPWALGSVAGIADGTYIAQEQPAALELSSALYDQAPMPQPNPGDLVVLEIKTMAHNYFTRALGKGPEPSHRLQAALSARVFGANWIHIVYISKGAKASEDPIMEWILPVNNDEVDLALADLNLAVDSAKAGVVPAPWYFGELIEYPQPKRPPCLWCQWIDQCAIDRFDPTVVWEERVQHA